MDKKIVSFKRIKKDFEIKTNFFVSLFLRFFKKMGWLENPQVVFEYVPFEFDDKKIFSIVVEQINYLINNEQTPTTILIGQKTFTEICQQSDECENGFVDFDYKVEFFHQNKTKIKINKVEFNLIVKVLPHLEGVIVF